MYDNLNWLVLNNAGAPEVNWLMVIAGIALIGLSMLMFLKKKK